MSATQPIKWSKNSKAGKLLKERINSGDIDTNASPKQVWESDLEFERYKLESLCVAYNKLKAELGCHVRSKCLCGVCFVLLLCRLLTVPCVSVFNREGGYQCGNRVLRGGGGGR